MPDPAQGLVERFLAMPASSIAATLILVLYAVQAEIRFGAKARSMKGEASDRSSTIVLSLASMVPVLGFILAMKGRIPVTLPGMPAAAWVGVATATLGFLLRLWSLLVLRERFTRTLLVQQGHEIERSGFAYRVRR